MARPACSATRARWASYRKRIKRLLLVLLGGSALLTALIWRAVVLSFHVRPEPAVPCDGPVAEDQLVARANDLLDRYERASHFGGVVLVAFGDRVRIARGFGDARDAGARLTCGSLAKQLTGYLVQRLAARGTLDLHARIDALLPELAGCPAGAVNADELLHMTSGLPATVDVGTNLKLQLHRRRWMSDSDLLARVCDEKLAFPPGTAFLYSNVGYRLLAAIASRVTSTPWPTLVRDEVFRPAGMETADVFEPGVDEPPGLLQGHLPYRCGLVAGPPCMLPLPHWNYSALWGAGAIHLRASDWLAWSRFLRHLAMTDADFFASYTRPDLEDYASGIGNEASANGIRVYAHDGEDPGYEAYFAWLWPTDVTLVVMSNTDYALTSSYAVGRELRRLLSGQRYDVVDDGG